jgi:hypothetical protein
LEAYLRHGVREVWQVYPASIVVYRGATGTHLAIGERLTTPLLNGFSLDPTMLFQ